MDALLLENGSLLLLESGDEILLEQQTPQIVLPILNMNIKVIPEQISMSILSSNAQVNNQGYTYNQATFAYDQTGVAYGGLQRETEDSVPILSSAFIERPSLQFALDSLDLSISQTQALLLNQGYTYDQVSFSYDQSGVDYGGIYNQNQDNVPLSLSFMDFYSGISIVPPVVSTFIPLGPGWFMYISQ